MVVKGFREYVLAHNWNLMDEPQVAEAYANPVEYSDPAAGAGSVQPFALTGQLCWTAAKGVYYAHAGGGDPRAACGAGGGPTNAPTAAELAALEAIRATAAALKAAEAA